MSRQCINHATNKEVKISIVANPSHLEGMFWVASYQLTQLVHSLHTLVPRNLDPTYEYLALHIHSRKDFLNSTKITNQMQRISFKFFLREHCKLLDYSSFMILYTELV